MCTAVSYHTKDHYFGRNLDFECSYGESVTITPRRFLFCLPEGAEFRTEYAMIGMAHVAEGTPLYYDVVNEKGLAMAGVRGQCSLSEAAGGEGQHSLVGVAALDFGAMRNRSRGKGAFGADCSDRCAVQRGLTAQPDALDACGCIAMPCDRTNGRRTASL